VQFEQPKSANSSSSQDMTVFPLDVLSGKNYGIFQRAVLKLGCVISVGTAGILLSGQTNQVFGIEPVETNPVDDGNSETSLNNKGERIVKAILREKVNAQKLVADVDSFQAQLTADSKQPLAVDNKQNSEVTAKLQVQQKDAIHKLQQKTDRLRDSLAQLSSADENRNSNSPSPIKGGYGMRWGRMHRGIDIANKIGTPIVAAASGVVEFQGRKRGYGNLVDIRHIDGSLTRYAHNHKHLVRVGQKVQQGEMIAHMGNTGFSTGPHLHFEIHPSGKGAENPIAYLPARV
jgi:murein DD-endopeptidase MepM/ murein hydrolase activator NlpD